MRALAVLLVALLPLSVSALTIQPDDVEMLTHSQLLKECREMGHGAACDREIRKGTKVERETFEACLIFKSVDDDSPIDDDTPQYLKGPGFSRYRSCLKHANGHSFSAKAVSVCSVMNDFMQHLECLDAVADKAFHGPTADACLKVTYASSIEGVECLKAVAGKVLSPAQLKACEKVPAGKRSECFRSGAEADLFACEKKLSGVELKIQELSASAGENRVLKQSIRPILKMLEAGPKATGGARDVR